MQQMGLFDHLVGKREQRRRHFEAENLGSFEIDDEFVLGRCLHRRSSADRSGQCPREHYTAGIWLC
jgi:hypothetical protein